MMNDAERKEAARSRQAAYRKKQREQDGSDEYKRNQAEKKAAYRAKRKAAEPNVFAADGVSAKYANELKSLSQAVTATLKKMSEGKDVSDTLPALKEHIATVPSQLAKVQKQADCKSMGDAIHARNKKLLADEEVKKIPKRKTLDTYLDGLNVVWRWMKFGKNNKSKQGENCTDFGWLKDTDKVIAFVDKTWDNPGTANQKLIAAAAILKSIGGFEAAAKIYSRISSDRQKVLDESKKENKLTPAQEKKYVKLTDLEKGRKSKAKKPTLGTKDDALISLYLDVPPRRLKDYQLMKVTTGSLASAKMLDDEFNYLVVTKGGKSKTLIYNEYKTESVFGQQVYPVPADLAKHLDAYVNTFAVDDGKLLFPNARGKKDSQFGNKVKGAFASISPGGKTPTAGLVRHAYVSYHHSLTNKPDSYFEEIATKMAHSLSMARTYRVVGED